VSDKVKLSSNNKRFKILSPIEVKLKVEVILFVFNLYFINAFEEFLILKPNLKNLTHV
jgi:hypothetical protein